jgi:hypothetical protein
MSLVGLSSRSAPAVVGHPDDRYKWVALINTTLGVLLVSINE